MDPVKVYCNNPLLRVPSDSFIYSPRVSCTFSKQGEKMVNALIETAPAFNRAFNRLVPVEVQAKISNQLFISVRKEFLAQQAKKANLEEEEGLDRLTDRDMWLTPDIQSTVANPKFRARYFEVKRNFSELVPRFYKRTAAPRITTEGSTFHGMKKDFKALIVKDLSKSFGFTFVDFDMGAAHSRVASSLTGADSLLTRSLSEGNFWDQQTQAISPTWKDKGIKLDDASIRKILKVALYTSLNGGNPASDARVFDNLRLNATNALRERNISTLDKAVKSDIFLLTKEALANFELANELKNLNKSCFDVSEWTGEKKVYTPDKDYSEPYVVSSAHLAISRVLQGFEVVMLTSLVKEILMVGGLPVSLDHDGVLTLFRGDIDLESLVSSINNGFQPWPSYLLGQQVPIEAKALI